MASLTTTDVVNRALALIGERVIDSYENSETEQGRTIRAVYPAVVEAVRDEFPWQELVKHGAAPRVNTPVREGEAAYKLPGDFERLLDPPAGWLRLEAGNLVMPESAPDPVPIRYLSDAPPPYLWSTRFTACVVELLAARLIGALLKDLTAAAQKEQHVRDTTIRDAKRKCSARDKPVSYMPRNHDYLRQRGRLY